jgi:hypothetical protein
VLNQDLGANSGGGGKIADNSVGGADINEALGTVPDAAKLGGYPATTFTTHILSSSDKTSAWAKNQIWSECGVAFISVPAGHLFDVHLDRHGEPRADHDDRARLPGLHRADAHPRDH